MDIFIDYCKIFLVIQFDSNVVEIYFDSNGIVPKINSIFFLEIYTIGNYQYPIEISSTLI